MDQFQFNTRFQIAAILLFSITVIDFIRRKKLPLLSIKYFSVYLIFTGINLIFDVLTVYSLANHETFNPDLNRFFHQVFIGSLNLSILAFYLYVDALCKKEKRITLKS